jgi:hypothetical protein
VGSEASTGFIRRARTFVQLRYDAYRGNRCNALHHVWLALQDAATQAKNEGHFLYLLLKLSIL